MREQHARILARLSASGMNPDMILSKAELAALIGSSERTVDRILAAGGGPRRVQITPTKKGFMLRETREWLAAQRESA